MKNQMLWIITLFFFACTFPNCLMQSKLKSNPLSDSVVFNKIYAETGNCFYISSVDKYVVLWAYFKTGIQVYKVKKNKILNKKIMAYPNDTGWLTDFQKGNLLELDQCLELDGSILGFKIKEENEVLAKNIPINIDCFSSKIFSSNFFKVLSRDIINYQINK